MSQSEPEDFLHVTLSSIGDAVIATDPDGRVTFLNAVAESLTGWSSDEAAGRPLTEVFRIVNEHTREVVENPVEKVLRLGQIVGLANHTILIARDGTEWPIDDSAAPIRAADGEIRGVVLIFREISERKRAERDRTQADERFRALVRASAEVVWTTDRHGNAIEDSPSWRAFTGQTYEQWQGAGWLDALHPDDRPQAAEMWRRAVAARAMYENEYRLRRMDGQYRWMAARAVPIVNSDGSIREWVGMNTDITERKRAEASLRESEARYRLIGEAANDAIWDWDLAANRVMWNPGVQTLFGYSSEEVGSDGRWWLDHIHPDDRQRISDGIHAVLDEGGERWSGEYRFRRADGSYAAVFDRGRIVRDRDGKPVRMVGSMLDLTERHQREEEIRDARQRLEAALEAGEIGTWIWDMVQDQVFADRNLARMFAVSPGEAQGGPLAAYIDALHPDDKPRVVEIIEAAMASEDRYEAEYRVLGRDGEIRWVVARGVFERDGSGQLVRMPGIAVDITERKRAEVALRYQLDLNRAITDNATTAIFMMDDKSRCTFMNPAAEAMTGFRFDEVRDRILHDFIHHHYPDGRPYPMPECPIDRALPEHFEVRDHEDVFIRKNGEFFPVVCNARVIYDNGVAVGTVIEVRDVTEERKSAEALRESERRLRFVLDSMPQKVFTATADGHVDYFNPSWMEFTGLSFEAIRDWGWAQIIHPDDVEENVKVWRRSLETGQPFEFEHRFRHRDGEYRWHLSRAQALRGEDGQVRMWVGANTDIDDAKRSELKATFLAEASAHLAELLDYRSTMQRVADAAVPAFSDWLAVDLLDEKDGLHRVAATHIDRDNVRLVHELAERYPASQEDPTGVGAVLRTGEPQLISNAEQLLASETVREDERRMLRRLGFRSMMCVPLSSKGRTFGALTFVAAKSGRRFDSSDLLAAQDLGRRIAVAVENVGLYDALKEADRRKDEFLATLAHELRNPLAPIRMGLAMLRMGGDDLESTGQMLATMETQVRHMVRLIDDLLDVSRITRGKLELKRARIELKDVVRSALEAVRPLVEENRHHITLRLPNESFTLDGDPARLTQVFINLLSNAAKYTPEGGSIVLSAERQGQETIVTVEDSGIGIPADMLERVFEMFTQVDRSLERSQSGLGIGLHLVRRMVELHGGSVHARSEGLNRGSTFVVRLPLATRQLATAQTLEEAVSEASRVRRRLLVADDNRDAADLLSSVLRIMGHEVHTVYDGQAAVEACESFGPDMALLDIGMPKLNGYDTARAIRRQPWGQRTLLVALTGWGQEEDRRRSREAGFDHHLVKPVEPAALQELLAASPRIP